LTGPLELQLWIGEGDDVQIDLLEGSLGVVASGIASGASELRARWRKVRAQWTGDSSPIEEIGRALWEILPLDVGAALQSAIGRVLDEDRSLSLKVGGDGAYELPWEWLYLRRETPFDPAEGPLALVPPVRIARESGTGAVLAGQDLRVLIVAADPGSPRFPKLPWLQAEARSIAAAFDSSRRRGIELRTVFDAMPTTLERALLDFKPHLLHFAGHGETRPGGGVIALNGPRANSERLLKGSELAQWLTQAETQLVFLSACDTAGASGSVAEVLIDGGVPSVVAMQTPIPDATQPHFARIFYGALLSGSSTDEAMAEARQSVGSPTAWASAVLFNSGAPLTLFESKSSIGRSPNNLPRFDSPFVGREREMEEVIRRCRGSRLVTLVGAGGMGKTRLAVEAAALSMDDFPDGVWRVECESCVTSDDVLFAIARTLEIEGDERAVQERIDSHLADRRILLVLDCLEGVVSAGGQTVVAKLREGSSVSLLVTSRFRLSVEEEVVVEVAAFDRNGGFGKDLILRAAGREGASLSPDEQRSLANICAMLEGVPLALMIAAGRLRFLAVAELESLLNESAYSTLGGRSSSLSTAIRRSLDLIPVEEIDLLSDLSVLAGSFSWAEVSEIYPEKRFEMLEGLGRLADRSLLQSEGDGEARLFRILDSLREYLALNDHLGGTHFFKARERHLEVFTKRAQNAADFMGQGRWAEGTRMLWDALPNLRSSLEFAVANARVDEVETLCRSLTRTLLEAGMWQEFDSFLSAGQRVAHATGRMRLRSYLLSLEGAARSFHTDFAGAEKLWLRRVDLCREIGNPVGACDALLDLALQSCQTGEFENSKQWIAEAEIELAKIDRDDLRAALEMIRCMYFDSTGDDSQAIISAAASEAFVNDQSSTDQKISIYMTLARHWRKIGRFRHIRETMAPILTDSLLGERRMQTAKMLSELVVALEGEGHIEVADRCFSAIVALYRELGSHLLPAAEEQRKAFWQKHSFSAIASSGTSSRWQTEVRLVLDFLAALAVEESRVDP
jgi:predicted ATPase